MSLRTRIALSAAAAVALAVILASVVIYATTARTLRGGVDRDLRAQARGTLAELGGPRPVPPAGRPPIAAGDGDDGRGRRGGIRPGRLGAPGSVVQFVDGGGTPLAGPDGARLPVDGTAQRVVADGGAAFSTVSLDGTTIRVYTVGLPGGGAVQIARSLADTEETLDALGRRLVGIGGAGILLAALLGLVVAERGVRPVRRLTESIEHVSRTGDLGHRIAVAGNDEPARLGMRFNEMLAGLDASRAAQEQLVADASHELRTPLTALRTNAELLASGVPLDEAERRKVAAEVAVQLDAFGRLVGDLVELTRGERPPLDPVPVDMEELLDEAVARARAIHPEASFHVTSAPMVVHGEPAALGRALGALLDNAVIHGGGRVEVTISDDTIRVRDHGPGIAPDDADKVFARFWRAPQARSRPGSGLGLSIVRQIARAHGADATIARPADGAGTVVELRLTAADPPRV